MSIHGIEKRAGNRGKKIKIIIREVPTESLQITKIIVTNLNSKVQIRCEI